MADEGVGTAVDDMMVLFPGDGARPQPAEMNPRPPGEKNADERQPGERKGAIIADMPEHRLVQEPPRRMQQQSRAGKKRDAGDPHRPGRDALLGARRPKRRSDPA